MLISPAPLAETATALRDGQLNLRTYIDGVCSRIDAVEPLIHALLPEQDRQQRLLLEAETLQKRFPDPTSRPPLYGILLGVKDMFRVDGFPTRAGSQLPAELFDGPEAASVTLLRNAGALILGKTISAEFAWIEPGPTRNPHNLDHTPGGSSSGSAAAVAAGFCPLALGSQTIGSTIRPAAFCGIVGFKPTYGRIPAAGLLPCSPSLDTVGVFTQDAAGMALVAPLLCEHWHNTSLDRIPVLGVPDGPYLKQASAEALAAFEAQLLRLEKAGYSVHHVPALNDIETINRRHRLINFAEMAQVHAEWFASYEALYRPLTVTAIRDGQKADAEELQTAHAGRAVLRSEFKELMAQNSIDLWVSPAAPGPAPESITTTGNSNMNLPWTYTGMPAITLPASHAANGLPLGLQISGEAMADEKLVVWAQQLAEVLMSHSAF
jgi:Asp-tRNA(Asn)/Glu-tRNA(Gln) amidotransferase A subunit family amidase